MLDISFQLSLGRFPLQVHEEDTIRDAKKKLRTAYPRELLQVNINAFRLNNGGTYLSDESAKVKDAGIANGAVLHFVKKNACPNATIDTEVPVDE